MTQYQIKERISSRVIAKGSDSDNTVLPFEGNLYFTPEAVNMENLRVTDRLYTCPYKGVCHWVDLVTPEGTQATNVGWVYRNPKPGYENIKDRIAFYNRATSGTIAETV